MGEERSRKATMRKRLNKARMINQSKPLFVSLFNKASTKGDERSEK